MNDFFTVSFASFSVICGLLLSGCQKTDHSEYFEWYEAAEAAYMGPDIQKAELELEGFATYLEELTDLRSNSLPSHSKALALTYVRLYEISDFKNKDQAAAAYLESAYRAMEKIEPGNSCLVSEEKIKILLGEIQKDPKMVPLWKKDLDTGAGSA